MNDKIMSNHLSAVELRALAKKLIKEAEGLENKQWTPPRSMLVEVSNHPERDWYPAMVYDVDFTDGRPYRTPASGVWRYCRPLRDPLIYQFRPHTPGDSAPSEVSFDTEVLCVLRNGSVKSKKVCNLWWAELPSYAGREIIGWLPLGQRY